MDPRNNSALMQAAEELDRISAKITEENSEEEEIDQDVPKKSSRNKTPPRQKTPPPPRPSVIPAGAREAAKKIQEQNKKKEQDLEEKERIRIYTLVCDYLQNDKFKEFLSDIPNPSPRASKSEVDALLSQIQARLKVPKKREYVEKMFYGLVSLMEDGLKSPHVLNIEEAHGIRNHIESHPSATDLDMEECAINLPDNFIPAAHWRLCATVMLMTQEFIRFKKYQPEMSNTYPSTGSSPDIR